MWRRAARLVTVGTLLLAVVGLAAQGAGAAEASPAGVAAAFTTTEVAVGAGVDRAVVLRLTNGTTAPATDVDLALVADPGIEIRARSAAPSTLAPGASVALVLDVSRANEAPGTASVHAVVRYVTGSGATAVAGAAVATLTVTGAPVPAAPTAPLTITPSNDAIALARACWARSTPRRLCCSTTTASTRRAWSRTP